MSPRYSDEQQRTILRALRIMEDKAKRRYTDTLFASPADTKQYFSLRLAGLEREEFHVAFLDNRHRLIEVECLHQGSIAGSMVSPREVVKAALRHNAAAVLLAHNHPSGDPDPSKADRAITERLKDACALVDVRVLDHLVVGGDKVVSFAERGWL